MDELRGRSVPLRNHSRESFTHLKLLSIPYMDRMEAQSKDLS